MMTTASAMGRLMAVVVAAIASVAVLTAASAAGTVNGTVTQGGSAVVGAKVRIASQTDSRYGATTTTDKDGSFSFSGTPIGGVQLYVYDSQNALLLRAKGEVQWDGQVVTIPLEITP